MAPVNMGIALGPRPLDRVQVASRGVIAEMRLHARGGAVTWPYAFFQRLLEDGRFEVMGPTGYRCDVDPLDVCNLIRCEAVSVRAMPRRTFLERLALPLERRRAKPADSCYRPAWVRHVFKDRWGRVDQTFVTFEDEVFNIGAERFATPIHPEDHARLQQLATRKRMPVVSPAGGYASAEPRSASSEAEAARATVRRLIESALRADRETVARLAAGAAKIR